MSTAVLQKLGAYEIVAPLGKGGMGEVWRARDTRLGRDVAVKLLPASVAGDAERVLRFEREARLLASLNHPNIGAIYGFEEHEGRKFLILEFVEGETLAARLRRGPLALADALDACRQIALALEAAHERGIIHRDLKPANVMITTRGDIKVLDFGLARALANEGNATTIMVDSPTLVATSPTLTLQYTQPGVILGTAQYMSPEQARGKPLDKGTDIWSFGIILYECLTTMQPFAGETATDSLGAIMHRDPDWAALPANTPPLLRTLLKRCLAKDKRNRLHDIADVRIEIESAINDSASTVSVSGPLPPVRRDPPEVKRRIPALAIGAVLVAAAFAGGIWFASSRNKPATRASTATFKRITDQSGIESSPSLTPDGRTVVYCAGEPGHRDILSLRIGGFNPLNLTVNVNDDDSQPAVSPDGQHIVFRSERDGGGLFMMGATGESPRRLTNFGYNPAWSPDGAQIVFATETIVSPFARNTRSALDIVRVDSGEVRELYKGDAVQPNWSPDGARIAFWGLVKGGQRDLFTIPVAGGEPVAVTDDVPTDWNPVWSPDGRHLYFSSDRGGSMGLWRVPTDPKSGIATGLPAPLTSGVAASNQQISISRDGRRLAFTALTTSRYVQRIAFDPEKLVTTGEPTTVIRFSTVMCAPAVAPDGQQVACCSMGDQEDIFVVKTEGAGRRQITSDHRKNRRPQWSPDGTRIAFYSDRTGTYEIWTVRADGSGLDQITGSADKLSYDAPVWSPDGTQLAANCREDHSIRIFDIAKKGGATEARSIPRPACAPAAADDTFSPTAWSADGRKLAGYFECKQSGTRIGYLALDTGEYTVLSEGTHPAWTHDGAAMLYAWRQGVFACDIASKNVTQVFATDRDALDWVTLSPNGEQLFFDRLTQESDIWVMDLDPTPRTAETP